MQNAKEEVRVTVPVAPAAAVMQKDDDPEGSSTEEQARHGKWHYGPRAVAKVMLFVCTVGMIGSVAYIVINQQAVKSGDQGVGVLGFSAQQNEEEPSGGQIAGIVFGVLVFLFCLCACIQEEANGGGSGGGGCAGC